VVYYRKSAPPPPVIRLTPSTAALTNHIIKTNPVDIIVESCVDNVKSVWTNVAHVKLIWWESLLDLWNNIVAPAESCLCSRDAMQQPLNLKSLNIKIISSRILKMPDQNLPYSMGTFRI